MVRGDDTCWDCYSFHAVALLLALFAQLYHCVIRILKVRQSWSNLWANLVINIMRCQSYDKNGETCDGNWPLTWPGGPGSSAFRLRPIKIFENETLKKKEKVSIPRSIKTKCHSMLTRWAAGLSIFGLSSDQPPVVGVVMSYFPGIVVKTQEHKESNIFEKCDFSINVFYKINFWPILEKFLQNIDFLQPNSN